MWTVNYAVLAFGADCAENALIMSSFVLPDTINFLFGLSS